MPSSYSPNLRFELQFTGENINTWGDRLNATFSRVDDSIAGFVDIPITADYVLQSANTNTVADEARRAHLKFSGTPAANCVVTLPSVSKSYQIWNATAKLMTFTTGAGNTYAVDAGDIAPIWCDGTNVKGITYGGLTLKSYIAAAALGTVGDLPAQIGNAGKFITTDGTNASWDFVSTASISDYVPVTGKQAIWIPAAAMLGRTTNGAGSGLTETTTNKIMLRTLDFDASTIEYAQFQLRMPKSWNEGTVSFIPEWSHGATTVNFGVSWGLQAVAISNDDPLDAAFGTAQFSNDTGGTTGDAYAGPESAAITIAGTPVAEDLVVFQMLRKADDGTNDTLAVDAKLHGVTLFFTNNAGTDD